MTNISGFMTVLILFLSAALPACSEPQRVFEGEMEQSYARDLMLSLIADAEVENAKLNLSSRALNDLQGKNNQSFDVLLYHYSGRRAGVEMVAVGEIWAQGTGGKGRTFGRAYVTSLKDYQASKGVCPLLMGWYDVGFPRMMKACRSLVSADPNKQLFSMKRSLMAKQSGQPLIIASQQDFYFLATPASVLYERSNAPVPNTSRVKKQSRKKNKRDDLASKRVDGIIREQTRCSMMGGCDGIETDSAGESSVVLDFD